MNRISFLNRGYAFKGLVAVIHVLLNIVSSKTLVQTNVSAIFQDKNHVSLRLYQRLSFECLSSDKKSKQKFDIFMYFVFIKQRICSRFMPIPRT